MTLEVLQCRAIQETSYSRCVPTLQVFVVAHADCWINLKGTKYFTIDPSYSIQILIGGR